MHLFAFIICADVIASVGQASMHFVHLPHLLATAESYSKSRSQIISAKKK